MKLIPKYTVYYKGAVRKAGVAFSIEPGDELEMSVHGEVVKEAVKEPPRKRGPKPKGATP